MFKINIISIGNFRKNSNYFNLFEEYRKRVPYHIRLIELKNSMSSSVKEQKILEGKNIIKNLDNNFKTIVLDERGEIITTDCFCKICNAFFEICGGVNFILGGSDGLSDEIILLADYKLSLGKMVFPHLMARVILIEQIYRVFTINNNHPYHK
ncbi:MAG: 23S rRNA (pseudouridine(1915)-N(3))-methyltransferase RlmH [Rickettsiales bacterium]|jgi:23S rRNA (pseudouridine1915-N3)-methyltransferase|nr:23S rRNA (pseudouridine(1915)-N(3))-methyltransferase RlmH [Rickettsiales bacterium]